MKKDINIKVSAPAKSNLKARGSSAVKIGGAAMTVINIDADYDKAKNKPQINGVTLQGAKSFEDLGENTISFAEIRDSVDRIFGAVFGGEN